MLMRNKKSLVSNLSAVFSSLSYFSFFVLVCLLIGLLILSPFSCSRRMTSIPDMNSPHAQTYMRRCMSCHALPHPSRLDMKRWEKILDIMKKRIEERGQPPLTEEEERMIIEYLRKYARD